MAEGIEVRITRDGSRSYRASVWDSRTSRRLRKTFPTMAAAKAWRSDALSALRRGTLVAPSERLTLHEAFERWLADAQAGVITTRSGDPYKPSSLRGYRQSLELRVFPDLGARRLHEIRRADLQRLVDAMVAAGHAAATTQGAVTALRALFKRHMQLGELEVNPTTGLKLPSVRSLRERIADPHEAAQLLAALPEDQRALWATAFYAGLRRGELMGLRWTDIDLDIGAIHVRRGWDPEFGPQETKNRQRRRVPIPSMLREHLVAHRLRQPSAATRTPASPSPPASTPRRSATTWGTPRSRSPTTSTAI